MGGKFWHLDSASVEGRTFSQAESWLFKEGGKCEVWVQLRSRVFPWCKAGWEIEAWLLPRGSGTHTVGHALKQEGHADSEEDRTGGTMRTPRA